MPRADDPYLLPNGTLQNKLGIKNAAELQRREGELAAARENVLLNNLPRPPFTYATLKRVHRDLFQDVYDWAGQQRTGSLRKAAHDGPSSPENLFAPPDAIAPRLDRLFGKLAADSNLTGLSRTAFAAGATEVLAEINSVHFAREGNGRAQRLLLTAIAANAGHSLAFDIITRERMVAVSIAAHGGDTGGMRRMFDEILDERQVGAMRKAIGFLDAAKSVRWNDTYISTTRPGESYQGVLVSRAGADFMMRTRRDGEPAILIGDVRDLPPGVQSGQGLAFQSSHFGPAAKPATPTAAIMDALRRPDPGTPAPWDANLTPLAARLAEYNQRMSEKKAAEAAPTSPPKPAPEPGATPSPRKRPGSDPGPDF